MAISSRALPFGMRQIELTPLGADGATPGTPVILPVSRKLTFTETTSSEDLRGDDTLVASHDNGAEVNWDMESGGISLEAYAVMNGGAVVSSGVTPNVAKTYTKDDADSRPYFKIEGRAISDSGGDFHILIYRAKATGDIGGELSDGTFWLTSATGKGYPSLETTPLGKIYDLVHNETAVAL